MADRHRRRRARATAAIALACVLAGSGLAPRAAAQMPLDPALRRQLEAEG